MKKRFTEAQIVGFLREADAGLPAKDLCRKHGFSEGSYYLWRSKFGGMSVSDAKRLKELETENGRLKRLLADALLENEVTREVLRKKMVTAPLDADGRRVAAHDLFDREFVLLTGSGGAAWADAAATLRTKSSVALSCVHIADDRQGGERHADFTRKYGVNPGGAVLVRPDGVIAWRAKGVAADPQRELRRVLARLGLAESRP
jgi:putative transposase